MRLRSLDGLRGFAALTVVFCHALISSQVFFAALYEPVPASRWSLSWWLGTPPFNLLWAGNQAVIIFFVLSGLVVTLPFVRSNSGWFGYYPRRFIRLYLPTWAAVGFTIIVAELVHRHAVAGTSLWLGVHDNPHWAGIQRDLTLYRGPDLLDGPLWSLKWEVWFSALLPLYVVFAKVVPRASLVKIVAMLALIAISVKTQDGPLRYLPAFGVGAAIAGDLEGVAMLGEWLRRHRYAPWVLLVAAVALIDSSTFLLLAHQGPSMTRGVIMNVGTVVGAALFVVLALVTSPVRWACETRTGKWLGKQSFSLYLVHEPIVVSVAILLGPGQWVGWVLIISLPLALGAAWIFQRLVEGPAHDLARVVGNALNPSPRLDRPVEASGVA